MFKKRGYLQVFIVAVTSNVVGRGPDIVVIVREMGWSLWPNIVTVLFDAIIISYRQCE